MKNLIVVLAVAFTFALCGSARALTFVGDNGSGLLNQDTSGSVTATSPNWNTVAGIPADPITVVDGSGLNAFGEHTNSSWIPGPAGGHSWFGEGNNTAGGEAAVGPTPRTHHIIAR